MTALRRRFGQGLTRVKNAVKDILRRHNLEQEAPTKGLFTKTALKWLEKVALPEMDRMEMDVHPWGTPVRP